MRKCKTCQKFKNLNQFHKRQYGSGNWGHRTECKPCYAHRGKLYRQQSQVALKTSLRMKKYFQANKKRIANRQKERRKIDVEFRVRRNMSRHVRAALSEFKGYKHKSMWKMLPYTPADLKKHLESQFDEKMSWKNYGIYWHIDHIIPQSKLLYDSMKHPNFQKCWALKNLQPLEAKENIRKGNKEVI